MKAIYPGTFDPPTKAHQWILEEARTLFEECYVVIGPNASKGRSLLSPTDKEKAWSTMSDAKVVVMPQGKSVVDQMLELGATCLVRGIRGPSDFEGEAAFYDFATKHCGIHVAHLMVPPHMRTISSTRARQLMVLDDWEEEAALDLTRGVILTIKQMREDRDRNS